MEKELKIIPPIGYEIDRQKSTFEKIVFKKIDNTPKTWKEYCRLNHLKDSFSPEYGNCSAECFHTGSYDEFHTKERAEQFIALGMLLQLRDYWVKRSKFEDAIGVFTWIDGLIVTNSCDINEYALTFPTQEMADKFITCFSDLIKQASPLV